MIRSGQIGVAGLAFTLLMACVAWAQPLPAPSGEVILTIDGAITHTNADKSAQFDLAMLQALPQATIRTTTPWTEGVTEFTGVPLAELLAAVGAKGAKLQATALNDYSVELPVTDENGVDPLVAYLTNGKQMPVREKGPLWIIYPFDAKPATQSETYYSRSIWQLSRLSVEP